MKFLLFCSTLILYRSKTAQRSKTLDLNQITEKVNRCNHREIDLYIFIFQNFFSLVAQWCSGWHFCLAARRLWFNSLSLWSLHVLSTRGGFLEALQLPPTLPEQASKVHWWL